MMELSHSLTLNEDALNQIAEAKRPVFIFEWLRFLDKVLVAAQKSDIKGCQKKLVEQLTKQIHSCPGPPTRQLIARCLATLFSVGDTFLLFDTINKCNDILKNKDDSLSQLATKLAAITCIGAMYQKLGRMMGRSYEETIQILLKCLRNAESQARWEIMNTLEKICIGMENAVSSVAKEVYKAARHCLTDRVMSVRCAAARCLLEMMKHTTFLYTTELESLTSLCFRAFEGSNYDVRCTVGKLLGVMMATTQEMPKTAAVAKMRSISLEEALCMMMAGFLRGGMSFLKAGAGEMIKGTSGVSRDIRVGVTHAYVTFVDTLGSVWLEKNKNQFILHVMELVSNPKAASSHVDAVYSRKCVSFMLRSVLGRMLNEKAQLEACKDLGHVISAQINTHDLSAESGNGIDQMYSQHALICALQELGSLFLSLGTTASLLTTESRIVVLEPVIAVLLHPAPAARLAAAWCLRCMALAIPSLLTPLIDKCLEKLETLKGSPEAISGYSAALAALLGAAKLCRLGIPHARGKIVFNAAEDLLRSASQNSRLSLQRTHAGWLLIGAVMTLGFSVVRSLLPRMLLIWRISFPRSARELESEIARGDAFTWHVTLEGRAGALSSIHSFLSYCTELVNPDVIRRILTPLESALAMMCSISNVIKTYSHNLKASSALLRFRLYEALSVLPPQAFESSYNTLLRFLVAEFTLTENPANTTTSLLRDVCHADDSAILGSWLQETDHKSLEDQLQPNSSSGSSALEHDPTALYRSASQDDLIPGSLPLGVSVINASVTLFGSIFPRVPYKHRLKMLEHFSECIRQNKSVRQEAVQINIFTAVLSGMKGLAEAKTNFGQDDVRKSAVALVLGAMTHSNPLLRWAAGEALGRMAQVVGDSRFVAEVAQSSFDKLKSARDVASRTGHSLALGCVHRYVGSMGSSQHLNTSVSILLALAQDSTSPVVQAWALYALALIADSGGPMFRAYVEPTLSLSLKLLLNVPVAHVDVLQCLGKCLSALITTIGPELHGNTSSVCTARSSFLCICAVLQEHPDPLVQSEAIACLQQLHMFAPRHVNLSSLVPALCRNLISPHLLLRRAAVSCLRQLAQREAKEVGEHASTVLNESNGLMASVNRKQGLPGLLFSMLDIENDKQLVSDIHDTLTSMLQALAEGTLSQWLSLCKDVLTSSAENGGSKENTRDGEGQDNEAEISDESRFHAREENSTHPTIIPRWKTRVFAAESVCRIFNCCVGIRAHFDLSLARDYQGTNSGADFLVLHLSDIVRIAFMAATSDSDQLRLEGLRMLQLIIDKFAVVPEPEFPGHVILEQYQAQVGAALRPAFSEETPSHVTAMACQVCSTWIGSKVARDLNDLRRVHQLLVSSLAKLKGSSTASQLYNESTATLEKLAILKAWAEVYVVAMEEPVEDQENCCRESLLSLVSPELPSLSSNWLSALRDHAILSLGPDATSIQRNEGGAFYSADTMDLARTHYQNSWIPILHGASLWLNSVGFNIENKTKEDGSNKVTNEEEINIDRFHLIFGICMEALCSPRSTEPLECVIVCLQALYKLLDSTWSRSILGNDPQLSIELCNVLHRLLLTRENLSAQLKVMNVLMQVMTATSESLATKRKKKLKEIAPANQEPKEAIETTALMGEGGECGSIVPGKSVVFAILEVCVCVLVRQMPALNPSLSSAATVGPIINHSKRPALSSEGSSLVAAAIRIMADLPTLCSPNGSLSILPTILYLTSGVLKELVTRDINSGSITLTASYDTSGISLSEPLSSTLQSLKQFASSFYLEDKTCGDEWKSLLRSLLDKILDISKTSSEEVKVDEVNMIIAIAVFIVAAPADVVAVPNLQFPCINLFKQAFESNNMQVRIKTVQALKSVFQHRDRMVATPYIQTLGAKMFEYLCSSEAAKPSSDLELEFDIECLHSLEVVVGLAEPEHCKQILSLAIPIFLKFLLDPDELSNVNKWRKSVHENALHKLMKIGPLYPQEFCTVMSSMPHLKPILEKSIRTAKENNIKMNGSNATQSNNLNPASNQRTPSIKLKTDFSNFSLK